MSPCGPLTRPSGAERERARVETRTKVDGVKGWAIVELMGKVRFGAEVEDVELAGVPMLRCTLPGLTPEDGGVQYVAPSALYRLTPVRETIGTQAAQDAIETWRASSRWSPDGTLPYPPPETLYEAPPLYATAPPEPDPFLLESPPEPVAPDACDVAPVLLPEVSPAPVYDPDEIPF